MEHIHDDRPGWVETLAEPIAEGGETHVRMLRVVPEDTHLFHAIVGNVAVRFPPYRVKYVYYWYYPDLIDKGVLDISGVQADVHKSDVDWPEDADIATIEYMVSIPEFKVFLPTTSVQSDGTIDVVTSQRVQELMSCPDCIYKRMLDEGMLEYRSTQTFAEVLESEEEAM